MIFKKKKILFLHLNPSLFLLNNGFQLPELRSKLGKRLVKLFL